MNEEEHWKYTDYLPVPIEPDSRQLVAEGLSWLATTFWTAMALSLLATAWAVLTWGVRWSLSQ